MGLGMVLQGTKGLVNGPALGIEVPGVALSLRVTSHLRMMERVRRGSIGVTLCGRVPLVLRVQMRLSRLKVCPRSLWRPDFPLVCRIPFASPASVLLKLPPSAAQKSMLRLPKPAPSAWQLYLTDFIQRAQVSTTKKLNVAQAAKEAGQEYANLSAAEKEVRFLSNLCFSDLCLTAVHHCPEIQAHVSGCQRRQGEGARGLHAHPHSR